MASSLFCGLIILSNLMGVEGDGGTFTCNISKVQGIGVQMRGPILKLNMPYVWEEGHFLSKASPIMQHSV